eukprot:8852952-Lingulodinium_polyedra.AAC.1
MAWHCASWPGLSGIFVSGSVVDQMVGVSLLRAHWAAFSVASDLGGGQPLPDQALQEVSIQWLHHEGGCP